ESASATAAVLSAVEADGDPRPASESPAPVAPPATSVKPQPVPPEPTTVASSTPTETVPAPSQTSEATALAAKPAIVQGVADSGGDDPAFVGRRMIVGRTPFRIGRNSESDFVLSFDPAVSNVHAEIDSTEQGWVIRDLDSANGTFLNGRRLVPRQDETLIFGVK